MTPNDIAWAAGFFEGEGCISVTKAGYPVLTITSTDKDVLLRFQRIFNGAGGLYPRLKRQPHHKDAWVWNTGRRADCKMILEAMLPYLGSRRTAKAEEVLPTCEKPLKQQPTRPSRNTV